MRRVGVALRLAAELRAGAVDPSDPRADAAVAAMARSFADLLGRRDSPAFRRLPVAQLDAHTNPRAKRYWELVGIIQGRTEEEFTAPTADYAWLLAAQEDASVGPLPAGEPHGQPIWHGCWARPPSVPVRPRPW
jgi:hypothetical protein